MDIQFGPLAPSVADQLDEQGYEPLDPEIARIVRNCAFYLDYLAIHNVISSTARQLGRKRLLKLIERHATRV